MFLLGFAEKSQLISMSKIPLLYCQNWKKYEYFNRVNYKFTGENIQIALYGASQSTLTYYRYKWDVTTHSQLIYVWSNKCYIVL